MGMRRRRRRISVSRYRSLGRETRTSPRVVTKFAKLGGLHFMTVPMMAARTFTLPTFTRDGCPATYCIKVSLVTRRTTSTFKAYRHCTNTALTLTLTWRQIWLLHTTDTISRQRKLTWILGRSVEYTRGSNLQSPPPRPPQQNILKLRLPSTKKNKLKRRRECNAAGIKQQPKQAKPM